MTDLIQQISGAKEKADELFGGGDKTSKNQMRSVFAHLKRIETLPDDELEIEIKLFMARLFYKSKRQTAPLSDKFHIFLKSTFSAVTERKMLRDNMKYFEAVMAYSYEYFGKTPRNDARAPNHSNQSHQKRFTNQRR